jgi:uncharacterized membrane protein
MHNSVQQGLQLYTEPLNTREIEYLRRKEEKDRRMYYKVLRILMFMSFIIPFITAWYREYDGAPNAFSYIKFFGSAGTLLFISGFATYMSYRVYLRGIQRDLKERTKTIETSQITKKVYVQVSNTYHLYISAQSKLSIEVSAADYMTYNEGDEVSIEYGTYSKEYFGYF